MSSISTVNQQVLRDFLEEVWNQGNVLACDVFLAPTYTIHHDPGDPWDGQTLDLEGFKARVSQSRAPFPDQRFDIQDLVGDDNIVACAWTWKGTHLGQVAHFQPTGNPILMSGITIYYFRDGRIAGHWQVVDRLSVFQQLQRDIDQRR